MYNERRIWKGLISKEFVDKDIDKIFVTPEEDGSLRLQIKVLTGESTDKFLQISEKRRAKRRLPPAARRSYGPHVQEDAAHMNCGI